MPDETLSATEAAKLLGVKRETLYAYTSRGLLRSSARGSATTGRGSRGRGYLRSEIERLVDSREAKRGPAGLAVLSRGEPLLDSSITGISPSGPSYRGRSALELAASGVRYESVAELLWLGSLPAEPPAWPSHDSGVALRRLAELLPSGSPPLSCLGLLLPALAALDPSRFDTRPEPTVERARQLIPRLAIGLSLSVDPARAEAALAADGIARKLAVAIGARSDSSALALLEQTLVLLADHELNASAFAARVAASTDADLYACLSAAVATLGGPLHGGASERVEALVREAGGPEAAERTVHARMRRGEQIPGFGHLLYHHGDPRAAPLLAAAARLAPENLGVRTVLGIVAAMREAARPLPNADVAITAVAAALELRPGMGPALFGIARCAGWVAHVLEQYGAGSLIRPRARYLGAE